MAELAVIVVSTNEAGWLRPCLSSVLRHAGSIDLDVVVADNDSADGTSELVRSEFRRARVVRCHNRGFGHANNRAFESTSAPFVLFLNPDTEIQEGTFADAIDWMRRNPDVGVMGVRQVTPEGDVFPTIRRFPSVARYVFEALAFERFAIRLKHTGERELDMAVYDGEADCDWVSGSFMLVRREALLAVGLFDERFFIYAEEVDLCLRIRRGGWRVTYMPSMTILHHFGKAGFSERAWSQEAFAKRQYVEKHFGRCRARVALGAIGFNYTVRSMAPSRDRERGASRRAAARAAFRTLVGLRPPPFTPPPPRALWPRCEEQ